MKRGACFILLVMIWTVGYVQNTSLDELEKALLNASTQTERMSVLKELAFLLKNDDREKAMSYARESLYLARRLDDQYGIAEAHHTLGMIYRYQNMYDEALDHFLQALKIREEIQDEVGLARSYNNIGQISDLQGNLSEALGYYEKSLMLRLQNKDSVGIIYSYISIGEVFEKQGDFEQAISSYADALIIANAKNELKGEAFAHAKMGDLFFRMKMYENAEMHYRKGLDQSTSLDDKNGIVLNQTGLATVLTHHGQYPEAQAMLEESLVISRENGFKERTLDAYAALTRVYSDQENYERAYEYQNQYTNLKDSIFNQLKSESLAAIRARHELEKKENEILELRRRQQIDQLRNISLWGLFAGLLLLGGLAIVIYRYRIQARNNLLLSQQKEKIIAKNRQLEVSNQELEDFAYAVSHDLKQPLRTIGSYSGLIKQRYFYKLGEEGQEYLELITGGVTQLHNLLSDLLTYSNVGSNSGQPQMIHLDEVMQSVKYNLAQQISESGAELTINPMPAVPGNYSALVQLFQNLISNGIKFNESPVPRILISYIPRSNAHCIMVRDNGIGIPEEFREKIFKAFQRLHTREKYAGSGIGLAISMKVVKQHGGRIWVSEAEDGGSIFWVEFPFKGK